MNQEKVWKTLTNLLCVLVLAVALPANAQMQDTGKNQSQATSGISALSLEEGVLGKSVKTRNGEEIGEINDVIFSRQGKIAHYFLDIGGFLGIGEKTVALNPDQVQFSEQDFVTFNGNRNDLENLPEVNQNVYRGYYGPGPYGYRPYGQSPYGPGMYNRPYYGPYGGGGYMGDPYDQGQRGQYQERQGQSPRGGSSQGRQPYSQEYSRRDYYERERGGMGQGQGMMRGQPGDMQGRMSGQMQGRMQGPMHGMSNNSISGNHLVGAQVLNRQNNNIGEIEDLVVDPGRGRVTHAVVGFGGFADIGDKQVLVPFNQLRHVGPYAVLYRGSEQRLQQMPEFQAEEGGRISSAALAQAEQRAGGGVQEQGGQPRISDQPGTQGGELQGSQGQSQQGDQSGGQSQQQQQ